MTVKRTFYLDEETSLIIDFLKLKYDVTLGEIIDIMAEKHINEEETLKTEFELFKKIKQ